MRLLVKMLVQDAIYWPVKSVNDAGEEILGLPIDIKCRWEDEFEQSINAAGTEKTYMTTVYTDRDVDEGGKLMLGTTNDLTGPKPPKDAQRISKFTKIPTLNATQWLRFAKL